MDDWFGSMAADCELPREAARQLHDIGFVVLAGPVVQARLSDFVAAYDAAVLAAHADNLSPGRSTTRVHDFVNRGPEFDQLYVYGPFLAACCWIIAQPFKLSTMHARAVNPNSPAQALHVDFRREEVDGRLWVSSSWLMIFGVRTGATRFVPGSHFCTSCARR